MFQKNLLLFTFCIFAYTTHAQIKNVDVNTDYTSLTYKLYSKSPLTKEVTYAELYPSKLNFLGPASIIPVMDPYLSLDAKKAKPNMPAKITFKYITQGLKNLTDDGNYVVNNNRYFPPRVEYYKRVSYTCPVTIEVYDSTNKLIKTIHVADSNHFF